MRLFKEKSFALVGLSTVALLAFAPACSPAGALCEKEKECASDPPGEDFIRVCTISVDGSYRALNANDEEDCKVLATAAQAYDACRAALDCDDYREADLGGNCDDERDDLDDAREEAGGDCTALD